MSYTIEIYYKSGDSFQDYETTGSVEITWENLDRAKEALQVLAEHERLHNAADSYCASDKDREAFENCRGYHKDKKYGLVQVQLPLDDGTMQPIYPFWQGYFERLISAKIVTVTDENGNTDMEVIF